MFLCYGYCTQDDPHVEAPAVEWLLMLTVSSVLWSAARLCQDKNQGGSKVATPTYGLHAPLEREVH